MEMAKPGFETYAEVRKYTMRLVKVLQHQKRRGRNINLVDAYQQGPAAEGFDDDSDQYLNNNTTTTTLSSNRILQRYILCGWSPPIRQQR